MPTADVDTSVAQTFTITVNAVNDAPSFTKGGNKTVLEDAGVQTFAAWATGFDPGPTNENGQTVLAYLVSNDNNPLFSAQPAVATNGTLTFTPAADANGSATVTVTVQDNGGTAIGGVDTSAPQTFTITVTAVNDPPSFTKGTDETVHEDTGASDRHRAGPPPSPRPRRRVEPDGELHYVVATIRPCSSASSPPSTAPPAT